MEVAWWILMVAAAYACVGLLFAAAFVIRGVTRVDHAAKGSRWTFRLLLVPGVAALWPLMLRKWAGVESHS